MKRSKIFNSLKKQNADIICIQEIHIKKDHEHILKIKAWAELISCLQMKRKKGWQF